MSGWHHIFYSTNNMRVKFNIHECIHPNTSNNPMNSKEKDVVQVLCLPGHKVCMALFHSASTAGRFSCISPIDLSLNNIPLFIKKNYLLEKAPFLSLHCRIRNVEMFPPTHIYSLIFMKGIPPKTQNIHFLFSLKYMHNIWKISILYILNQNPLKRSNTVLASERKWLWFWNITKLHKW